MAKTNKRLVYKHASNRSFGFMLVCICMLNGLAKTYLKASFDSSSGGWFLLGTFFGIITLVRPGAFHLLNSLWHKIGVGLQAIINPIILSALFYGVITPIGVIMRLFKKDILQIKLHKQVLSYWTYTSEKNYSTLKNQF
jgi:hypothetical protein